MERDAPILVVDCQFICYQAMYKLPDLSYDNLPTGIVYGFLSRMLSLGKMFKTNRFAFCWDSRDSLRRIEYPPYKHKRREDKSQETLELMQVAHDQFDELRVNVLPAIGFQNVFMQAGLEADDLIAELTRTYPLQFIIISADEDLFQCLKPNVRMYSPSAKKIMTIQRLKDEHELTPEEWAMAKAIAGCSTDCVEGIKGVGIPTVSKYINGKMNSTTSTYEKINDFLDSDDYIRNQRLVTLPHDATDPVMWVGGGEFSKINFAKVATRFGFRSFLEDEKGEWGALFRGEFSDHKKREIGMRRRKKDHE